MIFAFNGDILRGHSYLVQTDGQVLKYCGYSFTIFSYVSKKVPSNLATCSLILALNPYKFLENFSKMVTYSRHSYLWIMFLLLICSRLSSSAMIIYLMLCDFSLYNDIIKLLCEDHAIKTESFHIIYL